MQLKFASLPHSPLRVAPGIALFLLLLLAFLQYSASGVMRGGDDDEGSGIGGTGRTLWPAGEGGIGGTGLKPFLGMTDTQEVEILRDPASRQSAVIQPVNNAAPSQSQTRPAAIPAAPRVALVTRDFEKTIDSSAIDISESIQSSLDINALALAQMRAELTSQRFSVHTATMDKHDLQNSTDTSWQSLAQQLNAATDADRSRQHTKLSSLASVDYSTEEANRLARPERVQRPQLPPLQRVSPLQRTAILPPRVQPLRL